MCFPKLTGARRRSALNGFVYSGQALSSKLLVHSLVASWSFVVPCSLILTPHSLPERLPTVLGSFIFLVKSESRSPQFPVPLVFMVCLEMWLVGNTNNPSHISRKSEQKSVVCPNPELQKWCHAEMRVLWHICECQKLACVCSMSVACLPLNNPNGCLVVVAVSLFHEQPWFICAWQVLVLPGCQRLFVAQVSPPIMLYCVDVQKSPHEWMVINISMIAVSIKA